MNIYAIQGSTLALARWLGLCFEAVGLVRATSLQDLLDRLATGFNSTDHCQCFQNLTLGRNWDNPNTLVYLKKFNQHLFCYILLNYLIKQQCLKYSHVYTKTSIPGSCYTLACCLHDKMLPGKLCNGKTSR